MSSPNDFRSRTRLPSQPLTADQLIKLQHEHFGINYAGPPRQLSAEEEKFRLAAMMEELSEFVLADRLVDKYDALIDLMIFVMGTLERMGLPIDPAICDVIHANMQKELGPNTKRGGFKLDLRKPDRWVPADLERYL